MASFAPSADLDRRLVRAAIRLGVRELGQTWPNPAVGALIVRHEPDGPVVVGRGWTRRGGRPHAETVALSEAGERARGATCYVSLEPCSHHGRTPPCAEALVNAGVSRVVSAVEDPDDRVGGRGHAFLRNAGIAVESGVCLDAARVANAGHIMRKREGRPWITLKLAVSRDGMIGGAGRTPVQITGESVRSAAHMLRAVNDAILIGSGTALSDDPSLTCRLPGMADRSPVRVVLDTDMKLPDSARMLSDGGPPVWLIVGEDAAATRSQRLKSRGARLIHAPGGVGNAMKALAESGITRVLVEGGAAVAASFAKADLIDEAVVFDGKVEIGADGVPAGPALAVLTGNGAYRRVDQVSLGDDLMTTYVRSR